MDQRVFTSFEHCSRSEVRKGVPQWRRCEITVRGQGSTRASAFEAWQVVV